jgi:hypothetical protein
MRGVCLPKPTNIRHCREYAGRTARSWKTGVKSTCDAIVDLITRLIATGIEQKRIKTSLKPAQLMLLLWGQVFGVMQIILMRQVRFQETYGISYEDLFASFMEMTALALSGASPS